MSEITRENIIANIASVRSKIDEIKNDKEADLNSHIAAGRDVLVVAVSKTVGLEEVSYAIRAGIHDFGENRTSELAIKSEAYPNENWHFIGRIQTNKLKDVVGRACLIHSVASLHALEVIERLSSKLDIIQDILIEVNVSGELSKDGFQVRDVASALDFCFNNCPHIKVKGLMTMAPLGDVGAAKETFSSLRKLKDELELEFADKDNIKLSELSMGMSQDYEEGIRQGATIVRLGRCIFS